ncbi:MAG: PilZ domain-containing protein [Bradymonadia bacterium]
MSERRADARMQIQVFVDHILDEDAQCLCVSEDMSLDGMRVRRLPGQAWGEPRFVWLHFCLPGDFPLEIRALGELCHDGSADEDVRGFRFKYINPRDRRAYEDYLRSHSLSRIAS